ncbi:hypothetical protein D3C87_1410400 [compost metagenome]
MGNMKRLALTITLATSVFSAQAAGAGPVIVKAQVGIVNPTVLGQQLNGVTWSMVTVISQVPSIQISYRTVNDGCPVQGGGGGFPRTLRQGEQDDFFVMCADVHEVKLRTDQGTFTFAFK